MNHTPEPWVVQKLNNCRDELWLQIGYEKPDGTKWGPVCRINSPAEPMPDGVVAEIKHMATSNEQQEANAERIVACVNNLAGVKDPQKFRMAFDDMLGIIKENIKEFELLEKERPDATWIGRILDNNRMILKQAQEALGGTSPEDSPAP